MGRSLIDSHTHIYDEAFDEDREAMLQRALEAGVRQMVLPNVDQVSWVRMLRLVESHPDYLYPTIGLHPTSGGADYEALWAYLEEQLAHHSVYAIWEIGLDFYWDRTYEAEQVEVFRRQLGWADR